MRIKAEKVIELTRKQNRTYAEIAAKIGVTRQLFSRWINGTGNVSFRNVKELAAALNVPMSEISDDLEDKISAENRKTEWKNRSEKIMMKISSEFLNDDTIPAETYRKIVRIFDSVLNDQEDN